jgi:hypothetical protein
MWVGFAIVFGGLGLLLLACLLAVFVKGCRKKDPLLQLLGGVPFLACVAAGLYLVFWDRVAPLEQQARNLVELPAEAKVLKVEHGDWSGDGSVEFTLPSTRRPEEWLDRIWKANPIKSEAPPQQGGQSTRYSRSFSLVEDHNRNLQYLPKSKTYYYRIEYSN